MNLGVIILAHNKPEQLSKLLDALNSKHVTCFIHIDKKSNIDQFKHINSKSRNSKVIFIDKRYDGKWGRLGIVLATLEAMREAVADLSITHVSLLSGQDYPIVPIEKILDFLRSQPKTNFIEFTEFNEKTWPGQIDRIKSFNFSFLGRHYTFPYAGELSFKQKLLYQFFEIYFNTPRRIPHNMKPFFGSQWWSLTTQSCKEILKFVDNNPDYLSYHKYSFLPDEFFFQTILLNIDHFKEENFQNDNMRFIKWVKGSPHPVTLTTKYFDELITSGKLFARKFDSEVDAEIFNKLDLTNSKNDK